MESDSDAGEDYINYTTLMELCSYLRIRLKDTHLSPIDREIQHSAKDVKTLNAEPPSNAHVCTCGAKSVADVPESPNSPILREGSPVFGDLPVEKPVLEQATASSLIQISGMDKKADAGVAPVHKKWKNMMIVRNEGDTHVTNEEEDNAKRVTLPQDKNMMVRPRKRTRSDYRLNATNEDDDKLQMLPDRKKKSMEPPLKMMRSKIYSQPTNVNGHKEIQQTLPQKKKMSLDPKQNVHSKTATSIKSIYRHKSGTQFNCSLCYQTLKNDASCLCNENSGKHAVETVLKLKKFECHICQKILSRADTLKNHIAAHQKGTKRLGRK